MSELLDRLLHRGSAADLALIEGHDSGAPPVRYQDLRLRAFELAGRLLRAQGLADLGGANVALLAPSSAIYVEGLLAILVAGGTAVPLSPLHTAPELAHVLDDARPCRLLTTTALEPRCAALAGTVPTEPIDGAGSGAGPVAGPSPAPPASAPALMLYTSGTTGRPRGVVLSHGAVAATLSALEQSWGWRRDDRLLHALPLHHTHGVIVALLGGLWAGASVHLVAFDPPRVWEALTGASLFMGVPAMYSKLLEALRDAAPEQARAWREAAAGLRLFTSGSAALPPSLFQAFQAATGHTILERYGMTEIGMALSNPLEGERLPGTVGRELPGVEVEIVADDGCLALPGQPGELRVRSTQMFTGYYRNADATARAFDDDGRLRTGDTGLRDESGVVRLLGRTSVDVLKSAGYKISALEIEEVLREHPAVADIAVVGLPDETWGDRIAACVVLRPGATLTLDELRTFARDRLAPYKHPRELRLLDALPRNSMGKLQKALLMTRTETR
jgi:malonyl-CoA/methylmalonyl-CoA synthetase